MYKGGACMSTQLNSADCGSKAFHCLRDRIFACGCRRRQSSYAFTEVAATYGIDAIASAAVPAIAIAPIASESLAAASVSP